MRIFIDNKLIEINNLDDLYIGEGKEGIVYHYDDKEENIDYALKIYREFSGKDRLDLSTAKGLSVLDTKRILLPRKLVYDENKKFIGYVTEFVDDYSIDSISYSFIEDLVKEFDLIYNQTLSFSILSFVWINKLYFIIGIVVLILIFKMFKKKKRRK